MKAFPFSRRVAAISAVVLGGIVTTGLVVGPAAAGGPVACVDDKDAPGCPHDETPPWVADQYHFTGSNAAGWHFYGRNSGGSASAAHARALAHNLNYSECWVPWWSSEIACRD